MIGQLVLFAVIASCAAIDYFRPEPYAFGYDVKDPLSGLKFRHEKSDGKHVVKGSYGYTDPFGIFRVVDYVADHFGFRAKIRTNEPGTANQNPAFVDIYSKGGNYIPLLTYGKAGLGHHGPGPLLHRGVLTGARSGLHSALHAKAIHAPAAAGLAKLAGPVFAATGPHAAKLAAPVAAHAAVDPKAAAAAKALAGFSGFPIAGLLGAGGKIGQIGQIAPIAPIGKVAPIHFG